MYVCMYVIEYGLNKFCVNTMTIWPELEIYKSAIVEEDLPIKGGETFTTQEQADVEDQEHNKVNCLRN